MNKSLFILLLSLSLGFSNFQLNASGSYYEQAYQAFEEGNYEASYLYLKNALDQQPRNLPSKILMGKILLHKGYFDQSITQFEEALEYNADLNLIIEDYSSALLLAGRYKEILNVGNGSRLNLSSQYELEIKKASAYANLDLLNLAKKSFEKSISLKPALARSYNAFASFELSQKNYDSAMNLISKAIQIEPYNNKSWILKGNVHLAIDQINLAIEALEHSLELFDEDPVGSRPLVHAYIKANRLDDAQNLINNILKNSPNDPHMMLMASWVFSVKKNDVESKSMLESLVNTTTLMPEQQFNDDPSLILVKAISSYMLGKIEAASKDFSKYLTLVPGDVRAVSLLADIHIKNGRRQEAMFLLERYESNVIKDKSLALRLVDLYVQSGKRFDAERLLFTLQTEYPNEVDITLRQVELLNKSGRAQDAKQLIENLHIADGEQSLRLLLARGLMHLQNSDVEQAEKIANELVVQFPDSAELLNFKSAVLIKSNKAKDAEVLINKVLEMKPDYFEAKFNLATVFKMLGRIKEAQTLVSQLFELRPENNEVKFLLGETLFLTGQFDKAVPILESLSSGLSGQYSKELLYKIYFSQERYQDALRVSKSLTDLYLYNIDYLFMYIRSLEKLNRTKEAQQQLGIIYGLANSNIGLLIEVLNWQRRLTDYDSARVTVEQLKKLAPNNIRVEVESIRLLLSLKAIEEASQRASLLYKSAGNSANVQLLMGDIEVQKGQLNQAYKYYWQALETDPEFNAALLNLYQLSANGFEAEKLTLKLKVLIDKNPNNMFYKRVLADHYLNQGQNEWATSIYEELLNKEEFKENAFILNNLATIYLKYDVNKAHNLALKAYKINNGNAAIADTIGWVFYKQERYEEALQVLRNAFAMDSSEPAIQYHLSATLAKLNRISESKRMLQRALIKGKEASWFSDAQGLMKSILELEKLPVLNNPNEPIN